MWIKSFTVHGIYNFVMYVVLLVFFSFSIEVVKERGYISEWKGIFPGLLVNFR